MGLIRNRKTVEKKSSRTEKPKKNSIKTENRMKTFKTDTFSHPSYKKPDQSDTVVTSGASRVNYTYFFRVFVNTMDLAFVSSSTC